MAKALLDLYRAVRKEGGFKKGVTTGTGVTEQAVTGVLYPDFTAKTYFNKKLNRTMPRPADVNYNQAGEVVPGGGTSLFDVEGVFGIGAWRYFKIPKNTEIPASLAIVHTHYNKTYDAEHYQIEVANGSTMTVTAMKGALDNLARNAIVQKCKDAGLIK